MKYLKPILTVAIVFLISISIIKACEDEPKIVVETVLETEIIRDTITKVKIQEVPTKVYVNKYVTTEGEKEIVYLDRPNESSIEANQYNTKLLSNEASANLQITTTGELLDVQGIIEYPKETITTTIKKTSAKSGLFLYTSFQTSLLNIEPEVGAIYQFKNKVMVMGGVQYNPFTQKIDTKVGVGFKIW